MWPRNPVCVLNYTQSPSSRHWDLHQIPLGDVGTFLTQHYSIIPTMCGFFSPQCWVLPAWTVENPAEDTQLLIISTRLHWQLCIVQQPIKPVAHSSFYKYTIGEKSMIIYLFAGSLFCDSGVFVKHALTLCKAHRWAFLLILLLHDSLQLHFWKFVLVIDQYPSFLVLKLKWTISLECWLVVYRSIFTGTFRVTTKTLSSGTRLTC